jgi:hypothetical protein
MKIIPYFIDITKMKMKSISDPLTFIRLRVLLEGGTRTWEDNISVEQLKGETEDNDIYGKIYMQDDIGFVEVDSNKTPISDFYTYEEVQEKALNVSDNALLWRTFRVLIDDNMSLHSDLPDHDIFKGLIRSHLNIV